MPATQTALTISAVNAFAVATIAAATATRSITANTRDERGWVTAEVAPTVSLAGDRVTLSVPENFYATSKISREILAAAKAAVIEAFSTAGLTVHLQVRKQNGAKISVETCGFWHMGQWCVKSRYMVWRIA